MKKLLLLQILVVCAAFTAGFGCARPAAAQSTGPRTVGDGTLFPLNPGRSEGYGVDSGDIGGRVGTPLYTRHHRLGQDTGIGSSGLQTQSVTSESTPAAVSSFVPATSQFAIKAPSLASPFAVSAPNPALEGYTVPPSSGVLAGSGLTSIYSEMNSPFGQAGTGDLFQDLNTLPSFSRRSSRAVLPLSGEGNDTLFKKVQPEF